MIFSACELGVFDLLLKSQEPLSAQHVARELSTSVDGMERLLDALVGIEILEAETTNRTGEKAEEVKEWQDGIDICSLLVHQYTPHMAKIMWILFLSILSVKSEYSGKKKKNQNCEKKIRFMKGKKVSWH